ncbi:uncharacterized protein LOC121390561 [Gigantopelta aegis]|uniref:uncharacterized protein LOC121390561 n=1 Tax=Gigantopelta aegis TaxID=1735272 RepID=UPI001B88DECA|nr:uncharacterized protein LOC121390561 [Gigantopelta aegis]
MDTGPCKYQNNQSFGTHPNMLAPANADVRNCIQPNQNGSWMISYRSDDHASIDDGAVGAASEAKAVKPQIATEANLSATGDSDSSPRQPDEDDVSDLYAKVNKDRTSATSVTGDALPVMQMNQLYALVDETENDETIPETDVGGDVYAVVNKQKKSGEKSSECVGEDSKSLEKKCNSTGKDTTEHDETSQDIDVADDVYAVVDKRKMSGGNDSESEKKDAESQWKDSEVEGGKC